MSYQALTWATRIDRHTLPRPADKYVLLMLANYADAEGGSVFPSIARLEKDTHLARRTIQRALRRLEKAGLIQPANKNVLPEKYRPDKRPNAYRLKMPPSLT